MLMSHHSNWSTEITVVISLFAGVIEGVAEELWHWAETAGGGTGCHVRTPVLPWEQSYLPSGGFCGSVYGNLLTLHGGKHKKHVLKSQDQDQFECWRTSAEENQGEKSIEE